MDTVAACLVTTAKCPVAFGIERRACTWVPSVAAGRSNYTHMHVNSSAARSCSEWRPRPLTVLLYIKFNIPLILLVGSMAISAW